VASGHCHYSIPATNKIEAFFFFKMH
jgi:hypothetical protein